MIEGILALLLGAALTTQIVDAFKPVLPDNGTVFFYFSLFVGILIATSVRLDIFALLGYEAGIPYLGIFFAGVIVSQGSNSVHSFLDIINNIKKGSAVEAEYTVKDSE